VTYISAFWDYLNQNQFWNALLTHVELSVFALCVSILLCVPLGILCAKKYTLSIITMNTVNTLRVIPSLAILVILIPIMGTGFWPSLTALTVLACPPILINTYTGFHEVDSAIVESAVGMGMNSWQVLVQIETPLALGLVLTGCKTATVEVVASATLAAFIGGGGLGTFIINGLSMFDFHMVLLGAIPVALLAILSDVGMGIFERSFYRLSGTDMLGSTGDLTRF
jgi:osmoprotectant transport system permease protein